MAEKLKDAEDRWLESMFSAEPIADDGFSQRVLTRIRRKLWLRRLALPVAAIIGGAVAIRPAADLVAAISTLVTAAPPAMLEAPASLLPQVEGIAFGASFMQVAVLGAMMLGAAILGARILNE